jgi:hypothetical protein
MEGIFRSVNAAGIAKFITKTYSSHLHNLVAEEGANHKILQTGVM